MSKELKPLIGPAARCERELRALVRHNLNAQLPTLAILHGQDCGTGKTEVFTRVADIYSSSMDTICHLGSFVSEDDVADLYTHMHSLPISSEARFACIDGIDKLPDNVKEGLCRVLCENILPPHAVVVGISYNIENVPNAIRKVFTLLKVGAPRKKSIEAFLIKHHGVHPEIAERISATCHGCVRSAINCAEQAMWLAEDLVKEHNVSPDIAIKVSAVHLHDITKAIAEATAAMKQRQG